MKYEHLSFITQKLIMKIQPVQLISYKHNTYTTVASPVYTGSKLLCNFLNNQKKYQTGFQINHIPGSKISNIPHSMK